VLGLIPIFAGGSPGHERLTHGNRRQTPDWRRPYERREERATYRNSYRDRAWSTQVGEILVKIPRLREGSHFPSLDEGDFSLRFPRLVITQLITLPCHLECGILPSQFRRVRL
jgi:hypothetical protein